MYQQTIPAEGGVNCSQEEHKEKKMKFLKKIEWLIGLVTVMLMSSPAWAIRPRATMAKRFTRNIERFIDNPMNYPVMMVLLAIIVVLVIFILYRSRGTYDGWQTKHFGFYFQARARKIQLINDKKTENIRNILSTMNDKIEKIEMLEHQIRQAELNYDDKDTLEIKRNDPESKTKFSNESAKLAIEERLRTAKSDLSKFEEQSGSIDKLKKIIDELEDLDKAIVHSWNVMEEVPGFNPDDFKAPWD